MARFQIAIVFIKLIYFYFGLLIAACGFSLALFAFGFEFLAVWPKIHLALIGLSIAWMGFNLGTTAKVEIE